MDAAVWHRLILQEVGSGLDVADANERLLRDGLSRQVSQIWLLYADKAKVDYRLQYLYTKRHALDWLMGGVRHLTNGSIGPLSPQLGEKLENLKTLRDAVAADIELAESIAGASRPSAVAALIATAPIEPEGVVNGNDRAYRGDAQRRIARGYWPFYGGY
jgi:hypothetical protein